MESTDIAITASGRTGHRHVPRAAVYQSAAIFPLPISTRWRRLHRRRIHFNKYEYDHFRWPPRHPDDRLPQMLNYSGNNTIRDLNLCSDWKSHITSPPMPEHLPSVTSIIYSRHNCRPISESLLARQFKWHGNVAPSNMTTIHESLNVIKDGSGTWTLIGRQQFHRQYHYKAGHSCHRPIRHYFRPRHPGHERGHIRYVQRHRLSYSAITSGTRP